MFSTLRGTSLLFVALPWAAAQHKDINRHAALMRRAGGSLLESTSEEPCSECASLIVDGMGGGLNGCYDLKAGQQIFEKAGPANSLWCDSDDGASSRNEGRWKMGADTTTAAFVYHHLGCCHAPTGRWNTLTKTGTMAFESVQVYCSASSCASPPVNDMARFNQDHVSTGNVAKRSHRGKVVAVITTTTTTTTTTADPSHFDSVNDGTAAADASGDGEGEDAGNTGAANSCASLSADACDSGELKDDAANLVCAGAVCDADPGSADLATCCKPDATANSGNTCDTMDASLCPAAAGGAQGQLVSDAAAIVCTDDPCGSSGASSADITTCCQAQAPAKCDSIGSPATTCPSADDASGQLIDDAATTDCLSSTCDTSAGSADLQKCCKSATSNQAGTATCADVTAHQCEQLGGSGVIDDPDQVPCGADPCDVSDGSADFAACCKP